MNKFDLEILMNKLERRFERNDKNYNLLSEAHKGKETVVYNYFAGEKLGWYAGYTAALDLVMEELNIILEDNEDE